jgi:hypothetical protein
MIIFIKDLGLTRFTRFWIQSAESVAGKMPEAKLACTFFNSDQAGSGKRAGARGAKIVITQRAFDEIMANERSP